MTYEDMKQIDLMEIKSKEEAIEIVDLIIESDYNDVLKYINFLRYNQFKSGDLKYMKKITKFLFFDKLAEMERNHPEINFGDIEELLFDGEDIEEVFDTIDINDMTYNVLAQFQDDFEDILITKDKNAEYCKFGIIHKNSYTKYIYELSPESDEFYDRLVSGEIGTKANISASFINITIVSKSFIKKEIDVIYDYILARKTSTGVRSNSLSGMFTELKNETIIIPKLTFDEQERLKKEESAEKEKELQIQTDLETKENLSTLQQEANKQQGNEDFVLEVNSLIRDVIGHNRDKKIKSFIDEDIIIIGNCHPVSYTSDIRITDDYYSFNILQKNKNLTGEYLAESAGFISVITLSEYISENYHNEEYGGYSVYLIKNFTGNIYLRTEVDKNIVSPDELGNDYLLWDNKHEDSDIDISLIIESDIDIKLITGIQDHLASFDTSKLQLKLDNAIKDENYELAEKLQNQIKQTENE